MNFEKILEFKMPRYEELPAIELYIDQVLKYIETVFEPLEICKDEKPLTASMVNNYVKKGVVPATVKKRYSRPHIAYLFIVYIAKQNFTIDEIGRMVKIQNENYDIEVAYNYMCDELETILKAVFSEEPMIADNTKTNDPQRFFVRSPLIAFVNKIYTQKLFEIYDPQD